MFDKPIPPVIQAFPVIYYMSHIEIQELLDSEVNIIYLLRSFPI